MSDSIGHDKRTDAKKTRDAKGVYVSKLTPEVEALIVTSIRAGATLETAANYAGIARSTLHLWLSGGRTALNQARGEISDVEDAHVAEARFVMAVDEALSEFKIDLTGSILQHGREQWQAHAWLLERRFPDEFGRRQRIDHGNADGQPLALTAAPYIDLSKLTDEEIEAAKRILEKARPDALPDNVRQLPRAVEGA